MRNRTDGVCSQTAAPIYHTALAASAAYLCGQLHHIGLIRYGPPVLRSILRTCGSRRDRPDRLGFIYFSEDLSAGHDEPFRQTAVPDRASSGAGCLVSVGAALKAGNGGLSAVLLLQACYLPAAALALSLFTIYVFKKGMKYYAVNGSPRYSGFGHR